MGSNPYLEKLRSIQISPSVRSPESRKNYHDQQALDTTFGPDATERMLDDTDGLGYAKPVDGDLYHRPRGTGDVTAITADDFLGDEDG